MQQPAADRLQTWRATANVLEGKSRTTDKALSSILKFRLGFKQILAINNRTCYKILYSALNFKISDEMSRTCSTTRIPSKFLLLSKRTVHVVTV
jgi:hypothetical protein